MPIIRRQFGLPAMLVACVALIVALGGVSYAAGVLPKNSVGTAQLKKKTVTASKLRKNAVTSVKVKDGSLLAADFKAGQLPAGPHGPKGDTGTQGPKGDPGVQGPPGLVALDYNVSAPITNPANTQSYGTVDCDAGQNAVGGGVHGHGNVPQSVNSSLPVDTDTWGAYVNNSGPTATAFQVYVICTTATSVTGP